MTPDIFGTGPITQERAVGATFWLLENAEPIAKAKAAKEHSEYRLKIVKSVAMKASGETSAAAQEREAMASQQYEAQIKEIFDRTVEYERLANLKKAAEILIDLWRSMNANQRNGARV